MLKLRKKESVSVLEASKALKRDKELWPIGRALTLALAMGLILMSGITAAGLFVLGFPGITRKPDLSVKTFFEILKLTFGAIAGIGAAFALVIAYRKQRVSERAQSHAEEVARENLHDATERRVTELYCKAVEQLGHEKAAVRLGGLNSLARLGQTHPEHRQTVMDMICAYLRMPFQPPNESQSTYAGSQAGEDITCKSGHAERPDFVGAEVTQEIQVRLTAQRLLTRHLSVRQVNNDHGSDLSIVPETYWKGMGIDLSATLLINFDFSRCRPRLAEFRGAHFLGNTRFGGARFDDSVGFIGACFDGDAVFDGAQFDGVAVFVAAQFSDNAVFIGAQFDGDAVFDGAQFDGDAGFTEAQFRGRVRFKETQFHIGSDLRGALAIQVNDDHFWPPGWGLAAAPKGEMAQIIQLAESGPLTETPIIETDCRGICVG